MDRCPFLKILCRTCLIIKGYYSETLMTLDLLYYAGPVSAQRAIYILRHHLQKWHLPEMTCRQNPMKKICYLVLKVTLITVYCQKNIKNC